MLCAYVVSNRFNYGLNMKKSSVILLIVVSSILFFFLGHRIGSTADKAPEISIVWSWLIDLGTILAGVGTVIASYVGYLALSNWKSQSKGESILNRLLANQENIAILCCEFIGRNTGLMGDEREEMHQLIKRTENNFAIISRQVSPNTEVLAMKKLLFMPRVRIRDSGVLWDPEQKQLQQLELKIKLYIEKS